jgi:hypothetical protein
MQNAPAHAHHFGRWDQALLLQHLLQIHSENRGHMITDERIIKLICPDGPITQITDERIIKLICPDGPITQITLIELRALAREVLAARKMRDEFKGTAMEQVLPEAFEDYDKARAGE